MFVFKLVYFILQIFINYLHIFQLVHYIYVFFEIDHRFFIFDWSNIADTGLMSIFRKNILLFVISTDLRFIINVSI